MILSKQSIVQFLRSDRLRITPFDPDNLKSASYTFTLSARLGVPVLRSTPLDLRKSAPRLEYIQIDESGYDLRPGQFILGETVESVRMTGEVACILSGRATCAQAGLNVLQSSSFAEPGSNNSFILEINNSGPNAVRLFPGLKIVKGVFAAVSECGEEKDLKDIQANTVELVDY